MTQSEEFKQIPVDVLIRFLHSEALFTDCEYQVFASAMKWLCEDIVERRQHIYDVLAPIRLPLIPQRLLTKYVESCSDLSVKVVLQTLLLDLSRDCHSKLRTMKPLYYQPRKYARKTVYVIGGYTREDGGRWSDSQCLNTVESFNTFTKQWKPAPRLNFARSGHASAVLDGSVYVIGGEFDSMIYDSVERLDLVENRWSHAPSLTVPRSGLAVCTVNDRIYAFGGWIGAEIGRTIEYFDSQEKRWMVIGKGSSHSQRYAMGVVELQGNFLNNSCAEIVF